MIYSHFDCCVSFWALRLNKKLTEWKRPQGRQCEGCTKHFPKQPSLLQPRENAAKGNAAETFSITEGAGRGTERDAQYGK